MLTRAQPDLHASLPPRGRAGGRFLRDDAAGGNLRIRPAGIVDLHRQPEISGEGRGLVGRSVDQVRHLDLARLERDPHGGRSEQEVGRRQTAYEQHEFTRAPHAGLSGME